MPGPLLFGNLPTTTSVGIGRGGVLTVSNTTASPSVSISGALTAPYMSNAGPLIVPSLSASAPGLIFSADTSTGFDSAPGGGVGFYSGGSASALLSAQVQCLVPVAAGTNSVQGTGTLTSASTSATSLQASGTVSCGTNSATVGALSCASILSSGGVSQQQYSIRLYRSATQTIATNTVTATSWDTVETVGGGNTSTWPFTPPATLLTIPANGVYKVIYTAAYALSSLAQRDSWVELNTSTPGSGGRRYAEASTQTVADLAWVQTGSFVRRFSAGETLVHAVYQSTASNLNLLGLTGGQTTSIQVYRLSA